MSRRPATATAGPRPPASPWTTRLLAALVVMAALYTCALASGLLLPIVLAAFFALLLGPMVRRAPLRWLPRWLAALLLVGGLLGTLGAVAVFVSAPAGDWARKLPFVMQEAAPKLRGMLDPLREATRAGARLGELADVSPDQRGREVVVRPPPVDLVSATPRVLAFGLALVLLTFSFLVYGDDLLAKLLSLRPTRAQKQGTADLVARVQRDLSRYVLSISATSLALGAATAAYLAWLGLEDPLLWGVLAAVLNLAPIAGPLVMSLLLAVLGLSEFDAFGAAMLPAAGFVVLNAIEANVLTPLVLGRTMRLNPLAIILWLMLWGWLWGVAGLLLAVPMLVCLKIVAGQVEPWRRWVRLLE